MRSAAEVIEGVRLARTLSAEARHIEKFKRAISGRRPKLIVLAARGTSDNAAQFGRYLLEITPGIPVTVYSLASNVAGAAGPRPAPPPPLPSGATLQPFR